MKFIDGIAWVMTLGVAAVLVYWFVEPNSSGPAVIHGVASDTVYYVDFLMGK